MDGILSFWELSQPLVSRLAERLGLPANPPAAVDTAREKQVLMTTSGMPVLMKRHACSHEHAASCNMYALCALIC